MTSACAKTADWHCTETQDGTRWTCGCQRGDALEGTGKTCEQAYSCCIARTDGVTADGEEDLEDFCECQPMANEETCMAWEKSVKGLRVSSCPEGFDTAMSEGEIQ